MTTKADTVAHIADHLSISGECANCGVVQDCDSQSFYGAAQELQKQGWAVKDGELLCYGCVEES